MWVQLLERTLLIVMVVQLLPCKPMAHKVILCPKAPVRIEKEFTLSLSGSHFANMKFYQKITRLSFDFGSSEVLHQE